MLIRGKEVGHLNLLWRPRCASFIEVEHACYQCGQEVEDGRPFCPHCRAPQIHVSVAAAEASASDALAESPSGPTSLRNENFIPSNTYGSRDTILSPDRLSPGRIRSSGVDAKFAVGSALKAGLLGVFLGIIPILGILLTGGLAVYFYQRTSKTIPTVLASARLGGAAGIVVFAVNALATVPIILFHAQQQCVDSLTELFHKYGFNTDTPQFQASLHAMFTPAGLLAFFVVSSVLASVGGALASFMLRR